MGKWVYCWLDNVRTVVTESLPAADKVRNMPDRDYLPGRIPKHWRSTARLWKAEGFSAVVSGCARAALAADLREGLRAGGLDLRPGLEVVAERLVRENLLGPVRPYRLRGQSVERVDSEERQLVASLAPEIQWHQAQLSRGKAPTARPIRHRRTEDILREPISITGSFV